jgi:RNA polymerase sigma factor (sigma-70 family)
VADATAARVTVAVIKKTLSDFAGGGCLMGEMHEKSDAELLRAYAEHGQEAAFRELVARYTDLVYSAAIRQVESSDLAADIAQNIFVDLARKARQVSEQLANHTSLAGWLHRSTRYLALNHLRDTRRRLTNERQAMEQLLTDSESPVDWEHIRPALDEALDSLDDDDREALLLRYFQKRDFHNVGLALSVSDDTAQKRVSRAVERLREFFAKRGITVGAGGLVVILTANAIQAAPAGLAVIISTAALAGTAVTTSTVLAATTKAIAMTTLQKFTVAATVAVLAGAGIYEGRQAAQLRDQVRTLQQQQTPLVDQFQKLQKHFADATNRLADLLAENSRLQSNPHELELLRLRGEVARLRNGADQAIDPVVKQALRWKANTARMRELFAEHPEQQVPEMTLLSDQYFFDLARDQDLETTNGIRKAFSEIRNRAENEFAILLQEALQKFTQANSNHPPDTVLALAAFFVPPVNSTILERYQLIDTGKSVVGGWDGGWVVSQKDTPDLDYDRQWFISPVGFSTDPYKQPEKY